MQRRLFCEWPTLALIVIATTAWFLLLSQFDRFGAWIVCPLAALLTALQSSLQHEVLHGHPTRSPALNESLVYCSFGLFIPYRRFKALHLRHHKDEMLTDPYDDPESFYLAWRDWDRLPRFVKTVLALNNTLLGRLTLGPLVSLIGFAGSEVRALFRRDVAVRRAWMHHLAGLVPVMIVVVFVSGMPLWLYVIAVAYPAMSLLMLRTFAEHRAHEDPDARTIIVEFCPVFSFLFLNNNLHLVHHKHPRAPWYSLPRLYRDDKKTWHMRNDGYVFKSYFELVRRYLLRPKEPVAHPLGFEGKSVRHKPARKAA